MIRRAYILTVLSAMLVIATLSVSPASLVSVKNASAMGSPSSWNPAVTCTPLVVRITDITANQTGYSSFDASPFSPGITTTVAAGEAKRWLTPGSTPPGWVSPGPLCSVTNSDGTTSLFVQINGLKRNSLVDEDYATSYDLTNGGTAHPSTGDTTFNLFDPAIVHKYSTSCASPTDPTCHGIIHAEIDHDWKAAGYCGAGSPCDRDALESLTTAASTIIDVQGLVSWDPGHVSEAWHQFNGWEIHPLTAWRLSNTTQPGSVNFSWSPSNPQIGEETNFTATVSNGTLPSSFNWDFGDGGAAFGRSVSHIYVTAQVFTVHVNMTDTEGNSVDIQKLVTVGSWNPAASCAPAPATLESVIGNVTIQRVSTNPNSIGTDYSGGGFRLDGSLSYGSNPTTWPFFKRDLQPPCSWNGTPTFVEFHNVTVTDLNVDDCSTAYSSDNGGGSYPNGWQSCDTTFNLVTPGFGDASTCPQCYEHRIYVGIDRDWNASGVAPLPRPREGQRIDVQGFVYWNNNFLNVTWHSYTGWEIHPLTAWRPARRQVTANASFTPSNPTPGQTVTFSGTASGGIVPYTFTWDFGDGTVATGNQVSHAYASGTYIVHVAATDSPGAIGVDSKTVNVSVPPDFSLSADPNSLSFPAKSSSTIGLDLSSTGAFSGNVSLTVLASNGITVSIKPAVVALTPGNSAGSTITLSSSTPGNYVVTITGTSGPLSHSANVTVKVTDLSPTVSFTESATTVFRGQSITLTISSSDPDGTVTSLNVNWGDGTIDSLAGNATKDTHAYITAGIFTLNVTATDDGGMTASTTAVKTVTDAPPVARFTESATTAPTNASVSFDASTSSDSDGAIISYSWDFGDGSKETGVRVNHRYSLAGNYTITLTVTDDATLTASTVSVKTITDRPPIVSFSESATTFPTGTSIALTISASDSDGTLTRIIVVWGDGIVNTLPGNATSDSHTYSKAGSYHVYVNATDNANLTTMSSTATKTVIDRPPVVGFTESLTTFPTGTSATLTIFTSDPDGTVSALTVVWGDGTVDNLAGNATNDSHAYSLAGTYQVYVNATDDAHITTMSTVSTKTITDRAPTVTFEEDKTIAPTSETIKLTITSSDADGTVTGSQVNWGDGTVDNLPRAATSDVHSYSKAGTYTVTLTVTDNNNSTATTTATKTITDRPPVASFTESSSSVLTSFNINFDATRSFDPDGTIVGYAWNFGDSSPSASGTTATHSYLKVGSYTVVLAVTDNDGLVAMSNRTETVLDRPPVAGFTYTPSSPLAGQMISYDATASSDPDGTIASYAWDFGDGGTGTGAAPHHSYPTNGTFTILLTVTDDNGNQGTASTTITVGYDPAPKWLPASSLNATNIGFRSLALFWTHAVDSVQVSAYKLYLNGSLLVTLPGSVTSYNVAGLNPLAHYLFQVQASNPSGNWSVDGPSTLVLTYQKADVNHDCRVDIVDLVLVASSFGTKSGDSKYNPIADINGDGKIDIADLALVGTSFGQTC